MATTYPFGMTHMLANIILVQFVLPGTIILAYFVSTSRKRWMYVPEFIGSMANKATSSLIHSQNKLECLYPVRPVGLV